MLSLPLVIAAAFLSSPAWAASVIVSTADSRLPMSLSTVVSDLEAEGCNELSTACLICSRSVDKRKRTKLLSKLLDAGDIDGNMEAGSADTWKAVAMQAGFALAQPGQYQETASAAAACGGTILYYADPVDLERGEGLFDTLAPAMEKIMSRDVSTLYVLVDDAEKDVVQSRLENAAEMVLQNLVSDTPVLTLKDVFSKVVYVSPAEAVASIMQDSKTTPPEVAALVAEQWSVETALSWISPLEMTAADLAAARVAGPAARAQLESCLQTVRASLVDNETGQTKLIPNFGELCDAVMKQVGTIAASSPMGKQIQSNLHSDLDAALSDLFLEQLSLLQLAEFEEFKRNLSKLLISPNLQNDMESTAKASLAAFASSSKKLVTKAAQSSAWQTGASKQEYARKLREYVANRILSARASGKFKPLPRKGVTVGMHWLLPKPFGNDFRQEPWMVHATDNIVYIPKSKLNDVSSEDVKGGDWRSKIVPSPAGNDMLYMQ